MPRGAGERGHQLRDRAPSVGPPPIHPSRAGSVAVPPFDIRSRNGNDLGALWPHPGEVVGIESEETLNLRFRRSPGYDGIVNDTARKPQAGELVNNAPIVCDRQRDDLCLSLDVFLDEARRVSFQTRDDSAPRTRIGSTRVAR